MNDRTDPDYGNLILRRRVDEAVRVVLPDGREVRVTPITIECQAYRPLVHLAVYAPKDIRIYREEIERRD